MAFEHRALIPSDPTIEIIEGDTRADRDTLVFDHMEPGRPRAERRVLKLIAKGSFSPADFTVSHIGTVRVAPELARLLINS